MFLFVRWEFSALYCERRAESWFVAVYVLNKTTTSTGEKILDIAPLARVNDRYTWEKFGKTDKGSKPDKSHVSYLI